jgi:hypothetical protein
MSWTKSVPLASLSGEQWSLELAVTDDGRGRAVIRSEFEGRVYESDPAPITTKNMAGDLSHAFDEMKDKLDE